MKRHAFTPLFVASALMTATAPASAQVNRCVDAQGKVSFSDTLCEGIRAQKVFGVGSTAKAWAPDGYRQTGRDARSPARGSAPGVPARRAASPPAR